MAKKKTVEEEPLVSGETVPTIPPAPPSTDYCVVVNKTRLALPFGLKGTSKRIQLGPYTPGLEIHKSEPILKKQRTPQLFEWEKRGLIAFEPAPEGGKF